MHQQLYNYNNTVFSTLAFYTIGHKNDNNNTGLCIPDVCLTILTASDQKRSTWCESTADVFTEVQSTEVFACDCLSDMPTSLQT